MSASPRAGTLGASQGCCLYFDMYRTTEFIDLAAVEAWDTWFRWRERNQLKDVSIQDTWARVAAALGGHGAPKRDLEQRVQDAMEAWKLLPDARIIATAGTTCEVWPDNKLTAVLNIARFVRDPGTSSSRMDLAEIERVAHLAVEALDNALQMAPWRSNQTGTHLHIGLIGLADAFALMDIPYCSEQARSTARDISERLAVGCLSANLRLARDRQPRFRISREDPIAQRLREISPMLAKEAQLHGLRHMSLTAITSQSSLAQLANNVADAVNPLRVAQCAAGLSTPDGMKQSAARGYALEWSHKRGASLEHMQTMVGNARATTQAQLALRDAMQAWIDAPIDYPLSAVNAGAPGDHSATQLKEMRGR